MIEGAGSPSEEPVADFERVRDELSQYRDSLAREGQSKHAEHRARSRTLGRFLSAGLGLAVLAAGCTKKEDAGTAPSPKGSGAGAEGRATDRGESFAADEESRREALISYHRRIEAGSSVTRSETFARAYELAQKKYPGSAIGSISYESLAGVPVSVIADGKQVPVSEADFTASELRMVTAAREVARALGSEKSGGVEANDARGGESKTSPDVKDFLQ